MTLVPVACVDFVRCYFRERTSVMEEYPFPDLRIADFEFLSNLETREKCSHCGKSRMFYCYTCFIPLSSLSSRLPHVKLPYKVHVIKHPGEVCGKSTAVHAAVLAPEDVTIYTYPDIPEYTDDIRVVLVYPGGNAVTMQDYMRSLNGTKENSGRVLETEDAVSSTESAIDIKDKTEDALILSSRTTAANVPCHLENSGLKISEAELEDIRAVQRVELDEQETAERRSRSSCTEEQLGECNVERLSDLSHQKQLLGVKCSGKENPLGFSDLSIDRSQSRIDVVVFIDCTWFQVHKISSDPRLSGLQRIELTLHDTKFWRHQSDKPSTYLSTIEAMYYCAKEYHECCTDIPYDGQYDNLLFFFCFFYQKIRTLASKTGKKLKAYHQGRRKKPKPN